MQSKDVLKVNDNYLINLLKRKFSCDISIIKSKTSKLYYPCFAFNNTPCIDTTLVYEKREALYIAASMAINKLIEDDKINNKESHYYDDVFHKLFNGSICYS